MPGAEIWKWLALALGGSGVILIGYSALAGGAHVALVIIFPVVYGSSWELALGILLFFLAIVTVFVGIAGEGGLRPGGVLLRAGGGGDGPPSGRNTLDFGGVVLVGPFPIIFSSRRKWLPVLVIVAVALAVLIILSLLTL